MGEMPCGNGEPLIQWPKGSIYHKQLTDLSHTHTYDHRIDSVECPIRISSKDHPGAQRAI